MLTEGGGGKNGQKRADVMCERSLRLLIISLRNCLQLLNINYRGGGGGVATSTLSTFFLSTLKISMSSGQSGHVKIDHSYVKVQLIFKFYLLN